MSPGGMRGTAAKGNEQERPATTEKASLAAPQADSAHTSNGGRQRRRE